MTLLILKEHREDAHSTPAAVYGFTWPRFYLRIFNYQNYTRVIKVDFLNDKFTTKIVRNITLQANSSEYFR